MELTNSDIKLLNDFTNYFNFKRTWDYEAFCRLDYSIIAHFTGNQRGKTAQVAHQYVSRVLGWHWIPPKNFLYFECLGCGRSYSVDTNPNVNCRRPPDNKCVACGRKLRIHERLTNVYRFASETLPGDSPEKGEDTAEVSNTIYPAVKKWLPPFLLKRDITFRNRAMKVSNPYYNVPFGEGNNVLVSKEKEIVFEFVSFNQTTQSQGGVQRLSVWADEEPKKDFWQEQLPRLVAENGDIILTLTPANYITWTYDDIFERADVYVRTKTILDFLEATENKKYEQIEFKTKGKNIAVIQASTYDNPILNESAINTLKERIGDDPEIVAIRLYGIFKQVSGRVFKDFAYHVHVIDETKYFPQGRMFNDDYWINGRLIDYHEHNPWAICFVTLSPQNEMFVWWEWSPSPEKMITEDIATEMASQGNEYRFMIDLIDPLAAKIQVNTNTTVVEDLNKFFWNLKKRGLGAGASWQTWDTKDTKGRNEIRKRLKNSLRVQRPFNNKVVDDETGHSIYLPTLWVFSSCRQTANSLNKWRLEEWKERSAMHLKEKKEKPEQKFSHYCTALEAICKTASWRPRIEGLSPRRAVQGVQRFRGAEI